MAEFPVLETERLILREPRGSDFDGLSKMWTDPAVMKFIGEGKTFSRQQCWERVLRHVGHWHVNGYGPWVVIEKATGEIVGSIGYLNLKRDIEPPLDGTPELGWMLASKFHGKGMASEALKAAMQWGDRHLKNPKTACIIDPENSPSVKLAEKLGFTVVRTTTYNGHPTFVLERANHAS